MLDRISPGSLLFILWERGGARLKEVLQKYKGKKSIVFVVGPEGGLNEQEVEEAKRKGFMPVTLGKRILRSETASLCLLSILQYEWGDIG
jgi:16S rRNA (uracil1498-N3)-methyltransferase